MLPRYSTFTQPSGFISKPETTWLKILRIDLPFANEKIDKSLGSNKTSLLGLESP